MWFVYLIYPVGLLSFAIAVILFKYFYHVVFKSPDIIQISSNSKAKFYFYSTVNLLILAVWILFAVESSPYSNRVSDYGAPYGGMLLLAVIPVSLIVSSFLNTDEANRRLEFYRYIALSKLLWLISLVPGTVVILFYGLHMYSSG